MTFQRVLTDVQEAKLVEEYLDNNWTINDLSVIYRVSIRTVYRVLARHDVRRSVKLAKSPRKPSRTRRQKPVKAPLRPLQPCGTDAAYQRHRRAGEYPCTACLEAHAEIIRLHRNGKKNGK